MQARKLTAPQPEGHGVSRSEHLRAVALFAELKDLPGAIETLEKVMELRTYGPGDSIIIEGEAGTELFILVDGRASVFKSTSEGDQYKVAILGAEHRPFFGEGGLLDTDARSATIKADVASHCLVLNRTAFDAFCKENPQWALPVCLRIARAVMARLRKTNNDLMLLYNALVAEIRGT